MTNFGITGLVQVFNTSNNSLLTTISLNTYYPTGLCLSPDGSLLYVTCTSPNSVVIINTKTNAIVAKIPVNNPPSIGINCIKPGGCIGSPITFTITVVPAPLPVIVTSTDSLNSLTTTYGTPSTSESFTISGTNMRAGILITAPRGFEISLDNTNFSAKVTAGGPGLLSNITIYLRMPGTNGAGSYNGIIVLSSAGTDNVNIIIAKSMVRPAPLTITADNKTKAYGAPNPVLTLTYNGFENNDGPAQLIFPPVVSTTAALLSPPGNYPITVSNAFSSDYTMAYVPGILTITPDIIIPNAFTPNGDGINDTWDIQKIGDYPNCTVQVFNRYGEIVFSSIGYGTPWNGTYKGALLPQGTYYYIINLKNDVAVLSGYVVIVR